MDKRTKIEAGDYEGPMLKWDDTTITQEAAHMPDELRDDYVWLKVYCREQCLKDVDILNDRFRALGIHRDKTTWAKILRGRWKRDARGDETVNPVVAADKLAEEIGALRSDVRVETMRGRVPFVETTAWRDISTLIDVRRDSARVNKFGIVVGPTGAQKSACLKEYRDRNNHGTCILVEAPERGTFGELLKSMARAYGQSAKANFTDARAKIFQRLLAGTPAQRAQRCVMIDNAQELWEEGDDSEQPAFTFLRRLQDTTGCTVILSITPMFERKLVEGMIQGWFEQIEGRTGGRGRWLRLPEYAPEEDVLLIAKAFGLREPKKALPELVKISREPGRIRRLFEDLQDAKTLAGDQPFTLQHIFEAREGL